MRIMKRMRIYLYIIMCTVQCLLNIKSIHNLKSNRKFNYISFYYLLRYFKFCCTSLFTNFVKKSLGSLYLYVFIIRSSDSQIYYFLRFLIRPITIMLSSQHVHPSFKPAGHLISYSDSLVDLFLKSQ